MKKGYCNGEEGKKSVLLLVSADVIFDYARQRFFMKTPEHLKDNGNKKLVQFI
jgi:hypothetical protein